MSTNPQTDLCSLRPKASFGALANFVDYGVTSCQMWASDHEGTSEIFLYYVAGGTGAAAAAGAVWPLVNQMNPSADVKALSSIRVDISGVEPGTQLTCEMVGKTCLYPTSHKRRNRASTFR